MSEQRWGLGADLEPPRADGSALAGVDTTLPDGVDPVALATYCLMLGDDALVLSHRLSQWCSRGPDLETDIALTNIALDLLGQARLLLARAATAYPPVVPRLPEGSPVPPEDRLAFFREAHEFRNVRLVEGDNGDFAETVVRILLFSSFRLELCQRLCQSRDPFLAAVAVKATRELAYQRDWSARWFLTLAQGTEESRRRLLAGLDVLWQMYDELATPHSVEQAMQAGGIGVDPATVATDVERVLAEVFEASGIAVPEATPRAGFQRRTGRDGLHTEALSRMLAEMQVVARAHPMGRW